MYIHVKVTAGAKREMLTERTKDHFAISVTDPAERNLANKRVVILIAEHFGIDEEHVRIVNGHHSPSKLLSVDVD